MDTVLCSLVFLGVMTHEMLNFTNSVNTRFYVLGMNVYVMRNNNTILSLVREHAYLHVRV